MVGEAWSWKRTFGLDRGPPLICPDCTWPPRDFPEFIVQTSISGLFFVKFFSRITVARSEIKSSHLFWNFDFRPDRGFDCFKKKWNFVRIGSWPFFKNSTKSVRILPRPPLPLPGVLSILSEFFLTSRLTTEKVMHTTEKIIGGTVTTITSDRVLSLSLPFSRRQYLFCTFFRL